MPVGYKDAPHTLYPLDDPMPNAAPITDASHDLITPLLDEIKTLHEAGTELERRMSHDLALIHPNFAASSRNFLRYLGVRQHDIRPLQQALAVRGLSSFGLLEPHVEASLASVSQRLEEMRGTPAAPSTAPTLDYHRGFAQLQEHSRDLLGELQGNRDVRIMVTLPSEAATDTTLIPSLMEAGMDIARINCAHDEVNAWRSMIEQIRHAALTLSRACLVQIDLAGPKSRTGALRALGQVLKIRPKRDFQGRVTEEALLWISHKPPITGARADLPSLIFELASEMPDEIRTDDAALVGSASNSESNSPGAKPAINTVTFNDARGQKAVARIIEATDKGFLLAFNHTHYIAEGTPIECATQPKFTGRLVGAPRIDEEIRLKMGDILHLTRAPLPGTAAQVAADGRCLKPAKLHCTLEAAFTDAKPDQSVWLDDGRIGGLILSNDGEVIQVSITHAAPEGSKIKAEKGINFPDTEFKTPALTEKDLADLTALAHEVDIVALSFLRSPEDVAALQAQLTQLNAEHLGVVLKIENRQAFARLPQILLTGMRSAKLGIMIARGDLAVELGYERLSEVQEEILWLCEAAHVPVIWATQILESMAKSGVPTRPEVTDAAMSIRAECAMLNKGPHIVEALWFLNAVLGRMEGHYHKRMTMRRKLTIAELPGD
ncbi:MAG TPA: pyruvate kinase [Halothiobacillus sp.]|nr:pyruvate kinase [Halothiobacillus sp.]